jgi:hypothetical protein
MAIQYAWMMRFKSSSEAWGSGWKLESDLSSGVPSDGIVTLIGRGRPLWQ